MSDIDWNYYSMVGYTETWKVVCLSLEIDPRDVEVEIDHYASMLFNPIQKISTNKSKYKGDVTQAEIDKRYEIIEKRKYDGDYVYDDFTVDIEKFVKFANKLNLKPFPEKFLKLFQKTDNLTTNNQEAAKLYPETRWSIDYPMRDKVGYSYPLTQALEHFLSAGSPPPTAKMVADYWHSVKPDGISVDFQKKEFTYPLQEGNKTSSFKNLKDVMRGRITK